MILPTLYSLTSNGLTQSWFIEIEGNKYRTHEGIVDGVITISAWTECQGKNIGRSNETSPVDQALKEAKAKHKKKLEGGYHENIKNIDKAKFFEPMLAKKWQDFKDKVKWPVFSQPKLDGVRCIATKYGLFSRNGKPILSVPHIWEEIKHLFKDNPSLVLDGELYACTTKYNFNDIISLVRKIKPSNEDLIVSAQAIQYFIYDCFYEHAKNFQERFIILKQFQKKSKFFQVYLLKTNVVNNIQELDSLYEKYISEGYEGQMIRNNSLYQNKRTSDLLKRKEMIDEEFEIVDIESGRGLFENMAARAILKTKDGIRFEAGLIGSHVNMARLLEEKNEVIGKMGTVVFQNFTPDGKPRFGKLKAIRDYE